MIFEYSGLVIKYSTSFAVAEKARQCK